MAHKSRREKPERFSPEELAFQPWFLPMASRLAIDPLIPPGYRNKMRAYFDVYGCMVCEKQSIYHSNGMCVRCHHRIIGRLENCVRGKLPTHAELRIEMVMKERKSLAAKLLGRFAQPWKKMSLKHRLRASASLRNPVDDALGFITPGSWKERNALPIPPSDELTISGKSVRDMRPGRR